MLKKIVIGENSLDYASWQEFETADVCEFLFGHFKGKFPDNTRIYHNDIAQECDVTPADESGISNLQSLDGKLFVVTYPKFFLFGLFHGLFGILLLGLISYLLRPKTPTPKNTQSDSPNNGLSDRRNEARPLARIPDIFGKVRSTPDLLAKPYFVFENNREVEYAYLCIGRGSYLVEDIRDDLTPVDDIAGTCVSVYGPGTSPHTAFPPQLQVGSPITERIWNANKSNSVNGQVLRAPNAQTVKGKDNVAFVAPDQIVCTGDIDFEEFFAPDDEITISNSTYTKGSITINLDGSYIVLSVTAQSISLVDPASVNSDWNVLATLPDGQTDYYSPKLVSTNEKWIGPFIVEEPYAIYSNFVALQGLYKDDGKEQKKFEVEVESQFWEVDENGDQIGAMQDGEVTIVGSSVVQSARAATLKYTLVATAADAIGKRWAVRSRRITPKDLDFEGRVVDEVQWRDMYCMKYVTQREFGNVTTVHAKTLATSGALSIKERKLNCHATRKIPARVGNSVDEFTEELYPTQDAGIIFVAVCQDPYIGRRTSAEMDFQNIFNTMRQIQDYFGTLDAVKFNHTFDDKDMSFEETAATIADVIFSKAYRQGNKIKLAFEKKTSNSLLLFNHRNKLPRTEQRTIRFGTYQDNDGIDLEYVDQKDGATLNFLLPENGSALNPKKINVPGVQTKIQAHFHAWRAYSKILYQHVGVEFDATAEAALLKINDRIFVADNTRPDTFDGYIVGHNGLNLNLSQPFIMEAGEEYTIQLQHYDGTVELLDIDSSPTPLQVVLLNPPRLPLVTSLNNYAQTGYIIVKNSSSREQAFLVQEKDPKDNFSIKVSAINYDDRYYTHDEDWINGIFDGEPRTIFHATFEEHDVPRGGYAAFSNPGGFSTYPGKPVEVQNNVVGVGPAAQGDKLCELDADLHIFKDLTTDPAKSYRLMLNYSGRPGVNGPENAIAIFWNGLFVQTLETDATQATTTQWEFFDIELPTPTGALTRLEMVSLLDGGLGMGGLIDNVRVVESD